VRTVVPKCIQQKKMPKFALFALMIKEFAKVKRLFIILYRWDYITAIARTLEKRNIKRLNI